MDLLLQWNRKINLTSLQDPAEIVKRHFAESLFVAAALRAETGTLVDIGSGAGFPGLPTAVANPRLQVTLVESVGKKAAFLKEASRPIPNVSVVHGRFEDSDASFDWGAMRSVSPDRLVAIIASRVNNLALIVGRPEAARISSSPLFSWDKPRPVPWEPTRVLLVGNVPRGTLARKCFT